MGKGTIQSHLGDGQYSVQLKFLRENYDLMIAALNAKVTKYEAAITAMNAEIVTLKAAAVASGTPADWAAYHKKVRERDLLELRKKGVEKRITQLESLMAADPIITAWCADLTEDLSGDVGTIEVPGERGSVNIQPGYEGNAVYSAARDGQLEPAIGGTPSGTFWNLAMLPGWQKWKPTYRYGTITEINGDTCSVTLDAAASSQQSLDVNQGLNLTNVPIEYMTCNGAAFEVGDDVLVQFTGQDFSVPKVIGFKDNPVECFWEHWEFGDKLCDTYPGRWRWLVSGEFDETCPDYPRSWNDTGPFGLKSKGDVWVADSKFKWDMENERSAGAFRMYCQTEDAETMPSDWMDIRMLVNHNFNNEASARTYVILNLRETVTNTEIKFMLSYRSQPTPDCEDWASGHGTYYCLICDDGGNTKVDLTDYGFAGGNEISQLDFEFYVHPGTSIAGDPHPRSGMTGWIDYIDFYTPPP